MTIAYVITASEGYYSDQTWWVVRVLDTKDEAEQYLKALRREWDKETAAFRKLRDAWVEKWPDSEIRTPWSQFSNRPKPENYDECWAERPVWKGTKRDRATLFSERPEYEIHKVERGKWPLEDSP